jgi:hypothetical protein
MIDRAKELIKGWAKKHDLPVGWIEKKLEKSIETDKHVELYFAMPWGSYKFTVYKNRIYAPKKFVSDWNDSFEMKTVMVFRISADELLN